MPGRRRRRISGGLAPWVVPLIFPAPNAVWDADFVNNNYFGATLNGTLAQQQLVNLNPNFIENADGSLSTIAAATTVRRSTKGLIVDGSDHACQILQNRTLTNASWTCVGCTPLKDQTGRTGVANSASKLTMTADLGTCLQSVTISGSTFYGYMDVKRLSGTGTLSFTIDGTNYNLLDTSVPRFNGIARASVPATTPGAGTFNMGFRGSTNGDVWLIDFVDVNPISIELSPVQTTTAKLTGIRDRPSSQIADNSVPAFYLRDSSIRCIYAEFAFRNAGGLITASSGTIFNVRDTDVQGFSAAVTSPNAPVKSLDARLLSLNRSMVWQAPTQTGILLNGGAETTAAGGAPNGALTHWDWLTNGSGSAADNGLLTRMFGLSAIPPTAIKQSWTT